MIDTEADGEPLTESADLVQPCDRSKSKHVSLGESVVRGTAANFSVQPLTWASSLLAAAVVPRFLGSDGVGQLAIAFTITSLATVALDLGIGTYFTRRVAQNPGRAQRDLGVALAIQLPVFSLGALAIAVLAPWIAPGLRDFRILGWALIILVAASTMGVLTAALRGQEQHVRYAWLGATPQVLSAVGAALILFAGADVLTYTWVGVVLEIVGLCFSWKMSGLHPSLPSIDRAFIQEFREFVRGGFPFLSWNLTMAFYGGIDRLLLGSFVPTSEVGWYSAAYRIVGIPVFIPTLLINPLFPALSRNAHDPIVLRRAIAKTLRMTLLLTMPFSVGIYVIAPVVPGLLGWPIDFVNAVPLMMILSIQMPIVVVDMVLGTVIMAIGRERFWVRLGLAAAVLNIVSNLIAIPFFEHVASNGPIGASIVTALTEIWMFLGAVFIIPKHLLDSRILWQASQIILAGICAAVVATALLPIALVAAAVAGGLTYLLVAWLLHAVSLEDIQYVRERLSRRAF